MTLQTLFINCDRDRLDKQFNIECGISEWVAIELPTNTVAKLDANLTPSDMEDEVVHYETNRYDARLYDQRTGKTCSVYLYMDEDSETIIAIDTVVQDAQDDIQYALGETPFAPIIQYLQEQKEQNSNSI